MNIKSLFFEFNKLPAPLFFVVVTHDNYSLGAYFSDISYFSFSDDSLYFSDEISTSLIEYNIKEQEIKNIVDSARQIFPQITIEESDYLHKYYIVKDIDNKWYKYFINKESPDHWKVSSESLFLYPLNKSHWEEIL